jgi:hypothetical protein
MTTGKADITIITSLFRAESHLPAYCQRVLDVAAQVKAAGLIVEIVLVANDPSDHERERLAQLAENLDAAGTGIAFRLEVQRENLYASWNRGIAASSGRCLAIWNVDDSRTAGALIEGHRLIVGGCDIVDFPFVVAWTTRLRTQRQRCHPPQYDPANFWRKARTSPFFMFSRAIYERVGPFDEHFRIAGDFDWCARPAARAVTYCRGETPSGTFFLHGTNLSGSRNPLESVEDNIVMLRQGMWGELVPADPDLMRSCWTGWGDLGEPTIPLEIQERLWGVKASERLRAWKRQRRRREIDDMVRYLPRQIINRTGLRPLLARLGLVASSEK